MLKLAVTPVRDSLGALRDADGVPDNSDGDMLLNCVSEGDSEGVAPVSLRLSRVALELTVKLKLSVAMPVDEGLFVALFDLDRAAVNVAVRVCD